MTGNHSNQNSRRAGLSAGISRLLLVLNLCFFLAFPLIDGPVMGVDTDGYINMVSMREALYPLYLAFFRKAAEILGLGDFTLYGQAFYLFPAVLVQCALAAVVTWRFSVLAAELAGGPAESHANRAGLPGAKHSDRPGARHGGNRSRYQRPVLFAFIATLCQWVSVLLQRFGSKRGACYQEVVMTEGLAFSFYLMFLIVLVRITMKLVKTEAAREVPAGEAAACEKADGKVPAGDFVRLFVSVFLCVSIRKQLFVTVLIAAAAAFFILLFEILKKNGRSGRTAVTRCGWLLSMAVSLAAAVILSNGCERLYNYAHWGVATTHTGSSMGLDCTLIYISDAEDEALFEDPEIGEVFAEIRREAAEQNVLWDDANYGSWYDMFYHYSESYDVIGYNIMNPVIRDYLSARCDIDSMSELEYNMRVDEVEAVIKETLLTRHVGKYLYIWYVNFLQGFAVSVLKSHPILNWFIAAMYAVYFGMWGWLVHLMSRWRKKPADVSASQEAVGNVLLFAFLSMMGLVINNAVVSAVIYNQTRYAIYVMSSFYAALLMMAAVILEERMNRNE